MLDREGKKSIREVIHTFFGKGKNEEKGRKERERGSRERKREGELMSNCNFIILPRKPLNTFC